MFPYFFTFFFSIIVFYLSRQQAIGKNSIILNNMLLYISLIPLVLMGGFRDYKVGTDTLVYKFFYDELSTDANEMLNQIDIFNESGFKILEYFIKTMGFDYQAVMTAVSLIVIVFYYKSILKLSIKPEFSFSLLLLLCFYTFHFNAARQGIAVAVFFYSLRFIINRDFKWFFICICFGFLFHKTIILCLPIYFLYNVRFNLINNFIIIISIVLLSSFVNQLVSFATNFIDERYVDFSNSVNEGTGGFSSFVWTVIFLFFVLMKYINGINSSTYNLGLNMLTLSVSISILSSFVLHLPGSGILRLTLYFNQIAILMFPIVVYSFKDDLVRAMAFFVIFSVLIFYAYFYIYSLNGLFPYRIGNIV